MRKILITRPNSDPTTDYLYHWSSQLISIAKKRQHVIYDLSASKASKKTFDSYVNSKSPSLYILNGHGSEHVVTGQNQEVLISDQDSDLNKFSGTLCYARSCRSAAQLGKVLVQNGMSCFIGHVRDFIFFRDQHFQGKLLNDPIASLFLEPSNLVASTLLKGHSAGEANKRSIKAAKKNLRRILSSKSSPDEQDIAMYLWENISSQTLLGNSHAVIV